MQGISSSHGNAARTSTQQTEDTDFKQVVGHINLYAPSKQTQQYLSSPTVGLQALNSASRHNATAFTSQPIQAGKSKLHDEIQQQSAVKGINSATLTLEESTNWEAGSGADIFCFFCIFSPSEASWLSAGKGCKKGRILQQSAVHLALRKDAALELHKVMKQTMSMVNTIMMN